VRVRLTPYSSRSLDHSHAVGNDPEARLGQSRSTIFDFCFRFAPRVVGTDHPRALIAEGGGTDDDAE
jgi:hypothetical protein